MIKGHQNKSLHIETYVVVVEFENERNGNVGSITLCYLMLYFSWAVCGIVNAIRIENELYQSVINEMCSNNI